MASEQAANPIPLYTLSPSVDKSYLGEAFVLGGFQVGLYDVWYVLGREGMQVDEGFNWQDDRLEIIRIWRCLSLTCRGSRLGTTVSSSRQESNEQSRG